MNQFFHLFGNNKGTHVTKHILFTIYDLNFFYIKQLLISQGYNIFILNPPAFNTVILQGIFEISVVSEFEN